MNIQDIRARLADARYQHGDPQVGNEGSRPQGWYIRDVGDLLEALFVAEEQRSALLGQLGHMSEIHYCDEGWVCERHPYFAWPHDDCSGPGMPCGFRRDEASALGSAHVERTEVSSRAAIKITHESRKVYNAIPTYTCLRCHHTWVPRKTTRPVVCASCNSPYWDIPRPVKGVNKQAGVLNTPRP